MAQRFEELPAEFQDNSFNPEWLDGYWWVLELGKDLKNKTMSSARASLFQKAASRGYKMSTKTSGNQLAVKFTRDVTLKKDIFLEGYTSAIEGVELDREFDHEDLYCIGYKYGMQDKETLTTKED